MQMICIYNNAGMMVKREVMLGSFPERGTRSATQAYCSYLFATHTVPIRRESNMSANVLPHAQPPFIVPGSNP
jgi:hypothetical protein